MNDIVSMQRKRGERRKKWRQKKILVVDDNKEIVYSISELLKYEGYESLKAYDGMEALDIMERGECSLDPSGCDDANIQRSVGLMMLHEKSRIPVIMLSARRKKVIRCRDLRSEQMTILRSRIILRS